MKTDKPILDVCCGARMFYFDKQNQDVVFCDNREVERTLIDGRVLEVRPDVVADFRHLPFEDNAFRMVIFDPPHLRKAGARSWLALKYGTLPAAEQRRDNPAGVSGRPKEVLAKWNEASAQ